MTRPTVVILSFSNLATDPRVSKQIRFLADDHELICAGTHPPGHAGLRFIPLQPLAQHWNAVSKYALAGLLAARQHDAFYRADPAIRAARAALASVRADLWLANDLEALPLALEAARAAPVLYDAHEYAPDEAPGRFFQWLVRPYKEALCRRYLAQTAAMTTVSPGLAARYAQEFGVQPELLVNAPAFAPELQPSPVGTPVRLVHHGAALPNRRLERLIELQRELGSGYELHFMLTASNAEYRAALHQRAADVGGVFFHDAVPLSRVPAALNEYDIGLHLLEPRTFNDEHCLPNKFFEFVQGRLAVAIGPSPDMAALVREHDLGVIASDFEPRSMARRLRRTTPGDIARYKQAAHRVAHELSDGPVGEQLRALVGRLLG